MTVCIALLSMSCDRTVNENMTPDRFWSIIEGARGIDGDEAHSRRLGTQLSSLSPQGLIDFYWLYQRFHANAYQEKVWAAGMLLNGGHGTDDGFEYFRHWLIAQGKATYETTLVNPDSLAEIKLHDLDERAEFETYAYVIYRVFKNKTARELNLKVDRGPYAADYKEPDFDTTVYDSDEKIATELPRLWKKYGHLKQAFDKRVAELERNNKENPIKQITTRGLGVIKVGDYLVHKKYDMGKIIEIAPLSSEEHVTAAILFTNKGKDEYLKEKHYMLISPEHFSRPINGEKPD